MKKVIFVAFIFVSFLMADSWLKGSIVEVNDTTKTISLDTIHSGVINVKILPNTRIELDECGWFGLADSWIFSDNGNFKNLKLGRFIEVDTYISLDSKNVTASKIEVKCDYSKAY